MFSSGYYNSYYNATSGSAQQNVVTTMTIDGISTYVFTHPKIVAAAQAYFSGSSLTDVRIENQGTSGSAGSHWERKWFGNEFVTASVADRMPVSAMTLTLAEARLVYAKLFRC